MKKFLVGLLVGLGFLATCAFSATVLYPYQGGTGIGTATTTDVGKVLTVKYVTSTTDWSYYFTDAVFSSSSYYTTSTINNNFVSTSSLSAWTGSTNITTLGTIGTGVWNGTVIANTKGGTGQNSSGWTGFPYITAGTWATSSIYSSSTLMRTTASSTYTNLAQLLDIFLGKGLFSGGNTTDNGNGTISTAGGYGTFKTTNSASGQNAISDFAGLSNYSFATNTTIYVYANYNGGVPTVATTSNTATLYRSDVIVLATVFRDFNSAYHILNVGTQFNQFNSLVIAKDTIKAGTAVEHGTGQIIGASSTYPNITAGISYAGLASINTPAYDYYASSTEISFRLYYTSNSGTTWTISTSTSLGTTQYNNISSGLATVNNNKYGVYWVYMTSNGDGLMVLYGQAEYATLADAEASTAPTVIPPAISQFSFLVGRYIFLKSATTFVSIESPFLTEFRGTGATAHNSLSGLQGGTTDEYYHLTNAQNATLTSWVAASSTLRGFQGLDTTNSPTFANLTLTSKLVAASSTIGTNFIIGTTGNASTTGTFYVSGTAGFGTIAAGTWNGTSISTQYGGTGQAWNSIAAGSLPYFSGTGAMGTLGAPTTTWILSSSGTSPFWLSTSTIFTNLGLADTAKLASSTWLKVASNLSDLNSTTTARVNLIGAGSGTPTSTWILSSSGTTPFWISTSTAFSNLGLADTSKLASSTWAKTANNLSDLAATSTARANLGVSTTTINIPLDPATTTGAGIPVMVPYSCTLRSVDCWTDPSGSTTISIIWRSNATPFAAGTSTVTGLVCNTTKSSTTTFAAATISAGDFVVASTTAVSGATRQSIVITCTK